MAEFDFDVSEVVKVAADLAAAGALLEAEVRPTVAKAALQIKKRMQADTAGIAHAPHFPASITYDTKVTPGGVEAEVGPDKNRRQGALGNILAFGTSKNGPVFDIGAGLEAEAPILAKFLGDAVERALR